MEKIIGGQELENQFPVSICQKILWPCYEFIAHAEGLDDFNKNIIEEVILNLASINIRDEKEIARCTGLEADLISFMHSRLQQRGFLDDTCSLTEQGKAKLDEFSKKQTLDIHVYVDAVSGRVIPYWAAVSERNNFHYDGGRWDKKDEQNPEKPLFFHYRHFASAGKESDEEISAYSLHYGEKNEEMNKVPDADDVSAMLHMLYPKNDSIVVRIDKDQSCKKNMCYLLLDIMIPQGNTRSWVCSDGFGNLSNFFSVDFIQNECDNKFITGLLDRLKSDTNAKTHSVILAPKEYPRLAEKLALVQKNMAALNSFVNSQDKEEDLRSARNDSLLYLTQFAEWILFYVLHKNENEIKVRAVLADFEKFKVNKSSNHIIGGIAAKNATRLGFEFVANEKKSLRERYGKLKNAFDGTPSLFALFDLAVIALSNEVWLKNFAHAHPDFLSLLVRLNTLRNQSFHSGVFEGTVNDIQKIYSDLCDFLKEGLGVKIDSNQELSFAERHAFENERISAISRTQNALGFSLCHTLSDNLICFYTDMERRSADEKSMDNAVVLSMYQILETVFVQVNDCLGDELKNSDWKAKAISCGFSLDGGKECKTLLDTNEDRIKIALDRKNSTLGAACIAFFAFADEKLLRALKNKWQTFPADVSYIIRLRGHGEIPDKIDTVRVWGIKQKIRETIQFFARNGFLTRQNAN